MRVQAISPGRFLTAIAALLFSLGLGGAVTTQAQNRTLLQNNQLPSEQAIPRMIEPGTELETQLGFQINQSRNLPPPPAPIQVAQSILTLTDITQQSIFGLFIQIYALIDGYNLANFSPDHRAAPDELKFLFYYLNKNLEIAQAIGDQRGVDSFRLYEEMRKYLLRNFDAISSDGLTISDEDLARLYQQNAFIIPEVEDQATRPEEPALPSRLIPWSRLIRPRRD